MGHPARITLRFRTGYGLASTYLSMFGWCEILRKQYLTWEEAWKANPGCTSIAVSLKMQLFAMWFVQVGEAVLPCTCAQLANLFNAASSG